MLIGPTKISFFITDQNISLSQNYTFKCPLFTWAFDRRTNVYCLCLLPLKYLLPMSIASEIPLQFNYHTG